MSEIVLLIRGQRICCDVAPVGKDFTVRIRGTEHVAHIEERGAGVYQLRIGTTSYLVHAARGEDRAWLHVDGRAISYQRLDAGEARIRLDSASSTLTSPMPGTVGRVLVSDGDMVARGQGLVIVEAMKMEHVIRAPRPGRVRSIRVRPGETVNAGVVLVDLAEPGDVSR